MADEKLITITGVGDDNKVALYEIDARHPDGEIFVANDGIEHEAAETQGVLQGIAKGTLLKVSGGAKKVAAVRAVDEANDPDRNDGPMLSSGTGPKGK